MKVSSENASQDVTEIPKKMTAEYNKVMVQMKLFDLFKCVSTFMPPTIERDQNDNIFSVKGVVTDARYEMGGNCFGQSLKLIAMPSE